MAATGLRKGAVSGNRIKKESLRLSPGWNVGLEPTKLSTKKSKIQSVDFQQFINSIYYHFMPFFAMFGRILAEF